MKELKTPQLPSSAHETQIPALPWPADTLRFLVGGKISFWVLEERQRLGSGVPAACTGILGLGGVQAPSS